jgi:hypothetical protein
LNRLLDWVIAGAVFALSCSNEPASDAPVTTTAAAPAPSSGSFQKLVGRWLRNDMSYMIEIGSVSAEGTLDARYLNPQAVHVSRAEAKTANGAIEVLVELTDRGYPGSFYTLTYSEGEDVLRGVYHHLGLQQTFDVVFFRFQEGAAR